MYIYAYNNNSQGAIALKEYLGIPKIRHEGSRFQGRPNKTVINWGATRLPDEVNKCRVLNPAGHVLDCSDKLRFFRKISQTNRDLLPPWTEVFNEALDWVQVGRTVCARTVLNGHSANGLILMQRDNPVSLVQAPLYTKYIKKDEEYRVHIVNNRVVDTQRKTLSKDKAESGDEINWYIRNLANGFIYQRGGINPAACVHEVALSAMQVSGLDFGAVDVIFNTRQNRAYVLEINTAPGLQGSTIESYGQEMRRF